MALFAISVEADGLLHCGHAATSIPTGVSSIVFQIYTCLTIDMGQHLLMLGGDGRGAADIVCKQEAEIAYYKCSHCPLMYLLFNTSLGGCV